MRQEKITHVSARSASFHRLNASAPTKHCARCTGRRRGWPARVPLWSSHTGRRESPFTPCEPEENKESRAPSRNICQDVPTGLGGRNLGPRDSQAMIRRRLRGGGRAPFQTEVTVPVNARSQGKAWCCSKLKVRVCGRVWSNGANRAP